MPFHYGRHLLGLWQESVISSELPVLSSCPGYVLLRLEGPDPGCPGNIHTNSGPSNPESTCLAFFHLTETCLRQSLGHFSVNGEHITHWPAGSGHILPDTSHYSWSASWMCPLRKWSMIYLRTELLFNLGPLGTDWSNFETSVSLQGCLLALHFLCGEVRGKSGAVWNLEELWVRCPCAPITRSEMLQNNSSFYKVQLLLKCFKGHIYL